MKMKKLIWMLGLALLAALLVSGTAFAEGEEPSNPAPAETSQAPPEEQPVPEIQADTSAPDEPEPEPEPPEAGADKAGEPAPPPDADAAETLEAPDEPGASNEDSPQHTDEMVGAGEHPLADAPEATAVEAKPVESGSTDPSSLTGDPYYYNGGALYQFYAAPGACGGVMNCFDGLANSIQAAIDHFSLYANSPNDGVIYVESGLYSGNVNIDGSLGYLFDLLELKGLSVPPTIKGSLTISNMTSGFTLSGFIITGGATIKNSSGNIRVEQVSGELALIDITVLKTSGSGIVIDDHLGNVSLIRVKSSGNSGIGAYIGNYDGGNVTISNSAFDHNTGSNGMGLYIFSSGTITINGLSASGNAQGGIWINGFSRLTLKNAVLNNNFVNGGATLFTTKTAPVSLENVYAMGNIGDTGIELGTAGSVTALNVQACWNSGANSKGLEIDTTNGPGTVRVTNGLFNENGNTGLVIYSNRAITLFSVKADWNGVSGAWLDNSYGSGNILVTSPAAAGYTGANSFSSNVTHGLTIYSNGAITLTNVDAWGNQNGYGLHAYNSFGSAGIIINKNLPSWSNGFDGNDAYGMWLITKGAVLVSDTQAVGNGWWGMQIDTPPGYASVTRGQFNGNGQYGLYIRCAGNITLTDVSASDNGSAGLYYGALLYNPEGTGNVVVRSSNANWFHSFSRNTTDGIIVCSIGKVSISNVLAEENTDNGIHVNNRWVGATLSSTVSVARTQLIGNQHREGLLVETFGHVILDSIAANGNHYGGAYIDACYDDTPGVCSTAARVTLRGSNNEFIDNQGGCGLYIRTGGAVSLLNFMAHGNLLSGVEVYNQFASSSAPVSVSAGRNVWNSTDVNSGHGLKISSNGSVSISRLYSRGNLAYGAFVGGDPAPCGNVLITSSDFSSNKGVYGLFVGSSGEVALTNTLINGNTKTGLYILASGAVRLNGVEARGNGASNGDYDGAFIYNYDGIAGVTVTSTPAVQSSFSGNKRTGLYIKTRGAVSITNASASGNGYSSSNNRHSGIFIDESAGVAIRCTNAGTPGYLGGNMAYGLFVGNALGNITLSGAILLNDNQAGGAYLINTTPSPASNVIISGVMASNNQGAGIEAHSRGQVTIRSVLVEDNWQGVISVVGLYINNTYGAGNVTIAGSNHFNRNGGVGLYILTDGAVSVTGVNARDNGSSGIHIYAGGADKTVTLRSIRSQGNGYLSGGNGITISTFGNVTFSDVHALMNHDDGIHVNLNGYHALFQNCVMLGNDSDGLDLYLLGGTYNLVNCLYFGNDADNNGHITGDKDLNIH